MSAFALVDAHDRFFDSLKRGFNTIGQVSRAINSFLPARPSAMYKGGKVKAPKAKKAKKAKKPKGKKK